MSNNSRYLDYDLMRAIGITWIVGFWHMSDYTNLLIPSSGFGLLTECFLAMFFFLSGLLLNRHKKLTTKQEMLSFAKKRIIGFYFPFIVSAFTFIPFSWFSSKTQFVLTISGVSAFFPPMPSTLWFSSMLLLFYFFGFIALLLSKKPRIIFSIGIVVLLFILNAFLSFDTRLIEYAPLFVFGLLIDSSSIERMKKSIVFSICSCVLFVFSLWIVKYMSFRIISYLSFIICFMSISNKITSIPLIRKKSVVKIIQTVGISSSFAYFFHRQFYMVFREIYAFITGERAVDIVVAYLFLLPLFFLICYGLTVLYQKLTSRILNQRLCLD